MTRTETFSDILGDVFDIRTVIDRFEELEDVSDAADENEERTAIQSFLDDVRGYGGDHQWRGDWYPCTFIADLYFVDYAKELASDIGAFDRHASWPSNHVDWASAAEELRQDYSSVEINGDTYWYR